MSGLSRSLRHVPRASPEPSLILLGLAGLFLAFLVLLPLGWLLAFSLTDESGALSWTNLAELADPSLFLEPFVTT